jgi:NADH-quinone oxidoreductase subunit B
MGSAPIWPARISVEGRSVEVRITGLGLACCGLEVGEARRILADISPDGEPQLSEEPGLYVLIVAGTVTTALSPLLQEAWEATPEPRAVLAFGACAATGGPYWDSYSVVPGAHKVIPVDAWVAGCPPRPAELRAGIEELLRARD